MIFARSTNFLKFLLMAGLLAMISVSAWAEHPRSNSSEKSDFREPNSEQMRNLSAEQRRRLLRKKRRQEREKMIRERREKRFDRLHKEYGLEK